MNSHGEEVFHKSVLEAYKHINTYLHMFSYLTYVSAQYSHIEFEFEFFIFLFC